MRHSAFGKKLEAISTWESIHVWYETDWRFLLLQIHSSRAGSILGGTGAILRLLQD